MAYEGMVTEALAICRGVHERYHPLKRNPWNEIECGDHYARAMASWGMLISLAGFEFDGPAGRIGFAPRLTPGAFACVFTGSEGWGRYAQRRETRRQVGEVGVAWGRLRLRGLRFELPEGRVADGVGLRLAGRAVETGMAQEGRMLQLELAAELVVHAGQVLEVAIELSPEERG
jgi:hypothetical protein